MLSCREELPKKIRISNSGPTNVYEKKLYVTHLEPIITRYNKSQKPCSPK